jgi:hypothetical protein
MTADRRVNPKRVPAAGTLVIFAAAALAVSPLVIWGSSCGHDFDFHLVSWFDALNSWRHGILYPHWTPSANFGAGEPRFVFYSPLTWMLGAALAAVLPWALVPLAITFVLLAGTGLATRALAREALNEGAATLAGCIGIFSGYPLFTAYERTAFAELAGGVWIPLVLLYALRNSDEPIAGAADWRRIFNGSIAPLAVSIGCAWFSNPTVGVMACYTLAALAIVSAVLRRSWRPAVRAAAGTLLGIGLSAIYLLPAAWEQPWVDIHQVTEDPAQTLENNWLFARHADPLLALHDEVLHTASSIAVAMIALTLCAWLLCKLRRRLPVSPSWWVPLALIPIAVLFLQFPVSSALWNLLPDLRFLQFPWRWLLVLEAPMAVFLAAALWPETSARRLRIIAIAVSSAAFICATAGAGKFLYQECSPDDAVPGMLRALESGKGYEGTHEYEPIGGDIELIPMNLPQACLVSDPTTVLGKNDAGGELIWDAVQGTCEATFAAAQNSSPEQLSINGATSHSGFLILRLLTYPAWQVWLNGKSIAPGPARQDGLMAVAVPQGAFNLSVDWTTTRDTVLARWLSALSVFALTGLCLFENRLKQARLS